MWLIPVAPSLLFVSVFLSCLGCPVAPPPLLLPSPFVSSLSLLLCVLALLCPLGPFVSFVSLLSLSRLSLLCVLSLLFVSLFLCFVSPGCLLYPGSLVQIDVRVLTLARCYCLADMLHSAAWLLTLLLTSTPLFC